MALQKNVFLGKVNLPRCFGVPFAVQKMEKAKKNLMVPIFFLPFPFLVFFLTTLTVIQCYLQSSFESSPYNVSFSIIKCAKYYYTVMIATMLTL